MKSNNLLLTLCLLAGAVAAHAEDPAVLMFQDDADTFFKNYYYTGSEYFQFSTNGTYRQVAREHMFVEESDHGTWSQDNEGRLTLVSHEHYRDIECEPLSIFMWYTQAVTRLPWVRKEIDGMLRRSDEATFITTEIEAIEKYGYENCLSRVSVDFDVKHVPREKLEGLARRIDIFLNDEERHHFHATPMIYKDFTFLLWEDAQTPINRDLERIVETIDQQTKGNPAHIFIGIDGKTFQDESGKTQEFLYYPEMTEKVRSALQDERKELPTKGSSRTGDPRGGSPAGQP